MKRSGRHQQHGAAAIEMAFVFPLLFMLSYAGIVYGYTFYLQQTINFLAEESARTALAAADPTASNPTANLISRASAQFAAYQTQYATVKGAAPIAQATMVPQIKSGGVGGSGTGGSFLQVQVILPTSSYVGAGGGFAQVKLPGIGTFPPLPDTLFGTAQTAVN